MDEDRLIDIEIKLARSDDMLEALNKVVYEQQKKDRIAPRPCIQRCCVGYRKARTKAGERSNTKSRRIIDVYLRCIRRPAEYVAATARSSPSSAMANSSSSRLLVRSVRRASSGVAFGSSTTKSASAPAARNCRSCLPAACCAPRPASPDRTCAAPAGRYRPCAPPCRFHSWFAASKTKCRRRHRSPATAAFVRHRPWRSRTSRYPGTGSKSAHIEIADWVSAMRARSASSSQMQCAYIARGRSMP